MYDSVIERLSVALSAAWSKLFFSQCAQSTVKQGRSKFPPATEYIILYNGITPDHGYSTVLELLNLVLGVYGDGGDFGLLSELLTHCRGILGVSPLP